MSVPSVAVDIGKLAEHLMELSEQISFLPTEVRMQCYAASLEIKLWQSSEMNGQLLRSFLQEGDKPVTKADMRHAFGCFWNAAIGHMNRSALQGHHDVVAAITEGVNAIAQGFDG